MPSTVLDPSFGTQGTVSNSVAASVQEIDTGFVAAAPGGKLVVVGSAVILGPPAFNPTDRQVEPTRTPALFFERLNPNGSLDAAFGNGGMLLQDFGSSALGLAVQRDGKVIVGFNAGTVNANVARLTADGTLDPTFGNGGFLLAPLTAMAIALQPDGNLLVAGTPQTALFPPRHLVLARYDASGQLDSSFGSGGTVTTDLSALGFPDSAPGAMVAEADGSMVVAGTADTAASGSGVNRIALVRYTATGQLDTTFNGSGIVVDDAVVLVNSGAGVDLARQSDGKLVVAGVAAGSSADSNSRLVLARYNADGSVDKSFGNGGKLLQDIGPSSPHVAVLPDQTIVVTSKGAFFRGVEGFSADGTRQSTFLGGPDATTFPLDVAVQPDGQLLVTRASGNNVLVTRFAPSSGQVLVTGADAGGGPDVRVYDAATGVFLFNFFAFDRNYTGGVRVAVGDVNGDGTPDLIVGAGPGGGPQVRVFDGHAGAPLSGPLAAFFAFDPNFTGGVFVAAGDVNGDGFADIIVSADGGGGPSVTVRSGKDASVLQSFFAYDQHFTGGVRLAAGDVNGDGKADIVCGAGRGGGPDVIVFSGADAQRLASYFAYDSDFTAGIYVAADDVNGDGNAEVITGAGAGGGPNVTVFDVAHNAAVLSFFPYDPLFTGGVRVAALPGAGSGMANLVSVPGPGGGPDVRISSGVTGVQVDEFFAYDSRFTGGLFVAGTAD